ncbi:Calreticulin CRP55 [Pelomyxa schiedti]|nr:Calreticulin CRP55 [Pelomyxa schiedti]
MKSIIVVAALVAACTAHLYFKETFDDDTWTSRWTKSIVKDADGTSGNWKLSAGKWYNDKKEDQGLKTDDDARFYIISAPIEEFSNKGKDLVLQYTIKHEQQIDCGGGYLKLLPASSFDDPKNFSPDSTYNIMFGPDICGTSTRKTHVIFNHQGTNHLIKKEVKCETDQMTHLYTLIVHPDNTYEVLIDDAKVQQGSLEDDWDMVPPKEIPDPEARKPEDWVDDAQMDDPEDKKPEGYDDIPSLIKDPEAAKPEDWDDDADGEWEAPMIDNPAYKGPWKAKRIPNPAYKGPWVQPRIPNPKYAPEPELYAYDSIAHVGIEIWQVKSGTIFDNIIVTDSIAEAKEWAEKWAVMKKGEKSMFDAEEEKRRKQEEEDRKKMEEERKKEEEEKKDDDDDDDDDDEEDEDDDDDDDDDEVEDHHDKHEL